MIAKFTKAAPLHYPTNYRECAEFIRHRYAPSDSDDGLQQAG